MLSKDQRDEFLAVPELVRLVVPDNVQVPSLLVKTTSLMIKYFYRICDFVLVFSPMPNGELLCGVQINDDPVHPGTIWSLVVSENEIRAARLLAETGRLDVFLFNEAAINILSASVEMDFQRQALRDVASGVKLSIRKESGGDSEAVGERLDDIRGGQDVPAVRLKLKSSCTWRQLKNHYITNSLRPSLLDLIGENEGDQQEELAVWFTDVLHADGAVIRPQIPDGKSTRELCDVCLTYPMGSFLVESKALAILTRSELPDRQKLKKNTLKNIEKALSQLSGACRSLRRGLTVSSIKGVEVEIDRTIAPHCIVLVPDLSLLDSHDDLGARRIQEFFDSERGYLHIMDPIALLRSVQHALAFSQKSKAGYPPIMMFDYALLERWKVSLKNDSPDFALLMRRAPENTSEEG